MAQVDSDISLMAQKFGAVVSPTVPDLPPKPSPPPQDKPTNDTEDYYKKKNRMVMYGLGMLLLLSGIGIYFSKLENKMMYSVGLVLLGLAIMVGAYMKM